jgi:hypothetical protein
MGMLKIARFGFYRFAAVKRASSLFALRALLPLRSFALRAK